MIARCARCQGTFTTDRFGQQTCPHCGSELLLADPGAPPPAASAGQPPAGSPPGGPAAPPSPAPPGAPPAAGAGSPPAPPPPSGWSPPHGGGFGPYPPAGGPPFEAASPFAERGQRGFFAGFFETWKLVATQPQQFFRRVRIDQTGSAILFGVVASFVGNAVSAVYSWLSGQQAILAMQGFLEKMPEDQARFMRLYLESFSGRMTILHVVLTPILTLLFMYLAAGVLHLLLALFRGAKRPFDATLTVVAHASGLLLLLAVPVCGTLLALVWGVVVTVIGLAEAQRCGTGKAAAAVLGPAVLFCACCCLAAGLTLPAFLKGIEGAARQGTQTTTL